MDLVENIPEYIGKKKYMQWGYYLFSEQQALLETPYNTLA